MLNAKPIERRLQLAGSLLIFGLLIEAFTVLWTRPVAFVVFVAFGGILFAAGILLYLYSLVSVKVNKSSNPAGKTSDPTVRTSKTVQPTEIRAGTGT